MSEPELKISILFAEYSYLKDLETNFKERINFALNRLDEHYKYRIQCLERALEHYKEQDDRRKEHS